MNMQTGLKILKKKEKSIMGLHVAIEQADKIAYELRREAETKLKKEILNISDNNVSKLFFGKDIVNINSDNIDEIFDLLSEDFADIYNHNSEEQYKRFIEYFLNADNEYNNSNENM